jgi:hypothetical protein
MIWHLIMPFYVLRIEVMSIDGMYGARTIRLLWWKMRTSLYVVDEMEY